MLLHDLVNVDCDDFFQRSTLSYIYIFIRINCSYKTINKLKKNKGKRDRGNVTKLNKPPIIPTRGSHFFTNRTVNPCNSLRDSSVAAPTVSCLKSR